MSSRRRFGPARGDRVNFPHHNDRAIVLPDEDAPKRPARKRRNDDVIPPPQPRPVPTPSHRPKAPPEAAAPPKPPIRKTKEPPIRKAKKAPPGGWWTCPGCGREKCKFDKHMHHLVGHLTPRGQVCQWHRYLPDKPPPPDWPQPTPKKPSK